MTSDLKDIDGLGYFLYRSSATSRLSGGDTQDILHSARHRNQALGLTGCLHFEDGMFFQWLEGPRDGLVQAVDLILADDRHQEITVLDQGALDQRRFQDWRMRFSDRDRASLMDWFASSDKSTVRPKDYAGSVVAFLVSIAI